jgi:hypothetical protein
MVSWQKVQEIWLYFVLANNSWFGWLGVACECSALRFSLINFLYEVGLGEIKHMLYIGLWSRCTTTASFKTAFNNTRGSHTEWPADERSGWLSELLAGCSVKWISNCLIGCLVNHLDLSLNWRTYRLPTPLISNWLTGWLSKQLGK